MGNGIWRAALGIGAAAAIVACRDRKLPNDPPPSTAMSVAPAAPGAVGAYALSGVPTHLVDGGAREPAPRRMKVRPPTEAGVSL